MLPKNKQPRVENPPSSLKSLFTTSIHPRTKSPRFSGSLNKKLLGISGEDLATDILRKRGYVILTRNFRSRFGEIDIIAKDGEVLVFIEVKIRTNKLRGLPEEAVTDAKLAKIRQTSEYYLIKKGIKTKRMRIEVVSILMEEGKITSCKLINVT